MDGCVCVYKRVRVCLCGSVTMSTSIIISAPLIPI